MNTMTITVKLHTAEIYEWVDGAFEPQHEDAYLEKACCSMPGSSGYIECGCGGRDSVLCPAVDCPGIADYQVDALIDKLSSYEEDQYDD